MKPPDPRIVAWTLSGFIVGVLLTLLASGVMNRGSSGASPPSTLPPATLPPSQTVGDAQMYRSVRKIVVRELGQYPNVKVPRLVQLRLDPVAPYIPEYQATRLPKKLRSVFIEFRLYDHPLGKSWRLRSAKADVFTLLKALYTSRLPVYGVELVGIFPLPSGNTRKDTRALVAFIDHPTAARIPWRRWGRDEETRVWSLLDFKHVDPRFA